MKRLFALLLALALLLNASLAFAAEKPLYSATAKISAPVYAQMDKNSAQVERINDYSTIRVYAIYPDWIYISCDGVKGYVPRSYLNPGSALDKQSTPPWGVEVYHYVGTAGKDGVRILSAPEEGSDVLISLGEGTRFSIIEIEDGWARLIYWRQYGYVDTNSLSELLPVCTDAASGNDMLPIATYTSYYITGSDDVSVHGKEINIGVNVGYMNGEVLKSGASLNYDDHYGSYTAAKGYTKGPVLIETGWGLGMGGGVCQVSTTLYNVLLQLPGVNITYARTHGPSGVEYVPLDMDAAVGNPDRGINMIFKNEYDFDLRFEAQAKDGALYIALYKVCGEE
ncbi:MAG: VanW family protein [Clostridia bacterium]|nr:VanW family protein [Clostridia bacterium]